MRWVSWIVVTGAAGWLLYTQVWIHVPEKEALELESQRLQGTLASSGSEETDGTHNEAVPYDAIYTLIEAAQSRMGIEPMAVGLQVRSRSQNVQPETILLSLDDGRRVHRFAVDRQGAVALPLREDWRRSGFMVRSNQPAGTLDFEVTTRTRSVVALRQEFSDLDRDMGQDRRVHGFAPGGSGLAVHAVETVAFGKFSEASMTFGRGVDVQRCVHLPSLRGAPRSFTWKI